jgi:myo-inositol-1(or 4)-monophosphatase
MTNITTGDDDDLLVLAARLAVSAGEQARDGRRGVGVQHTTTKSSAIDLVTEFDRAAERLIVDGILVSRPHDGIVGEEGSDRMGTSGVVWFIDPIDGTTNFVYDLPGWAVSVAACRQQPGDNSFDATRTVAGAVFVPATGELFTARKGHGAHLNGRAITCSTTADLATALVATGLAYRLERRAQQIERLSRVAMATRDLRRMGAAAVDLCYVGAGRLDAYYEQWLSPWDMAAGELIAREAGCLSTGLDGSGPDGRGPAVPDGVLVANPSIIDEMSHLLSPP